MSYFAKINKETQEIINYEESTHVIVEIKTRAEMPEPKLGFNYVEKVKQLEDGTFTTEWEEREIPLTPEQQKEKDLQDKLAELQESISKAEKDARDANRRSNLAQRQSVSALQAVVEITPNVDKYIKPKDDSEPTSPTTGDNSKSEHPVSPPSNMLSPEEKKRFDDLLKTLNSGEVPTSDDEGEEVM